MTEEDGAVEQGRLAPATIVLGLALVGGLLGALATRSPPPALPTALSYGGGVAFGLALVLTELLLALRRFRSSGVPRVMVAAAAFLLAGALAIPATRVAWARGARIGLEQAWTEAEAANSVESWEGFLRWAQAACPELVPPGRLPLSIQERGLVVSGAAGAFGGTNFVERVEKAVARHDDLLFQAAARSGGSLGYRSYLRALPRPRHRGPAETALAAYYRIARERLKARTISGGVLPQFSHALSRVLEGLQPADPETSRVGVVFLPQRGLESGTVTRMVREVTGSSRVHEPDEAFQPSRVKTRRERLVAALRTAVTGLVGDVLELAPTVAATPGPRFLLGAEVAATGHPATPAGQDGLPPAEQIHYADFVVFRSCTLQVPRDGELDLPEDVARGARLSHLSRPGVQLEGEGATPGDPVATYSRMADRALDEFLEKLGSGLGG